MKIFTDRTAVVTGGASGIGLGMVQNFLDLGMKVAIIDYNPRYLEEIRQTFAGRNDVLVLEADVGDREQVRQAANAVIAAFGKVHVLCNNAGVGGGGDTIDDDFDAWDRALRINLGGVVNGTKIFAPLIQQHGEGGHIVNTSSMAGLVPLPLEGTGAYQTAKFAVRGFTESLRYTLAPTGIGVSCLFPGGTQSRLMDPGEGDEAGRKAFFDTISSWMDPLEMGARVVEGIRANAPYILTHSEFREELKDIHAELDAAFPEEQEVPEGRMAFEIERQRIAREKRSMPVKD